MQELVPSEQRIMRHLLEKILLTALQVVPLYITGKLLPALQVARHALGLLWAMHLILSELRLLWWR